LFKTDLNDSGGRSPEEGDHGVAGSVSTAFNWDREFRIRLIGASAAAIPSHGPLVTGSIREFPERSPVRRLASAAPKRNESLKSALKREVREENRLDRFGASIPANVWSPEAGHDNDSLPSISSTWFR